MGCADQFKCSTSATVGTAATTAAKTATATATAKARVLAAATDCKFKSMGGMPCTKSFIHDSCQTKDNKDFECSGNKCTKKDDTAELIFWIIVCCAIILSIVGCICCCMCCCKRQRVVYMQGGYLP